MGEEARRPKYVVVNADEMEPGTIKDRLLLEGNPHQLIEGIVIAAYAVQADDGLHLPALGLQAEPPAPASAPSPRRTRPATWAGTSWAPATAWSCTCTSAPAATCAARRTACSTRWRASGPSRARSRPTPSVCGLWGKPTRGEQRGDRVLRAAHRQQRRRVVPRPEPHGGRRHQDLRRQRPGEAARRSGSCRWARPCARCSRSTPAACARATASGACCRAAPPPASSCRSSSTCRWTSTPSTRPAAGWAPAP